MSRRRRRTWLLVATVLMSACGGASADRGARAPALSRGGLARRSASELLAAAESTYGRSEYDSARAIFTRALDVATTSADTVAGARALTWIGLASWRLGNYADARTFGERALAVKLGAGLTGDLSKSYNALGLLAHNEGRFGNAIDAFTHAAESAAAAADSAGLAKAVGNRGLVYSDIGDFTKASDGISVLRRFAHDAGDARLEANALVNLGMVDIRAGAPRSAMPLLANALKLHRSIANAVGEENALGQLGTAYDGMGEPQLALSYLDSALSIARRRGLRQQASDDLQLIAGIYDESGDHARALDYLTNAAVLSDSMKMRKIQGDIARAQSRALFALGNLNRARDRANAARRFDAGAGAKLEQLEDELLVAELEQRAGAAPAVHDALQRAREIAQTLEGAVPRVELALGEARVAELASDPATVLRVIARAAPALAAATTGREWEAQALTARAYAKRGQLMQAVGAGRRAVRAIERVRSTFSSGMLRSSFTAERAGVYADLALVLLRLGRTDDAFAVADAARGRALLEHIAAAGRSLAPQGAAGDLREADALLRRIDRLVAQLRSADTVPLRRRALAADDGAGFLSRQLADSRLLYETLMERARLGDSRVAALSGGGMPNVALVRAALQPGEAMIEYFVTADRLVTFVVDQRGIHSSESPLTEDALMLRVRLARDLVMRREATREARRPVLRGLYGLLIAPAKEHGWLRDVRRVIIVPHASLAYLPFAALLDPASDRYLVEEFDLLLLPSGASLPALRREPPVVAVSGAAARVFAPFPDDLPGTRAEVDAVRQVMGHALRYVGSSATEQALRSALAEPRIVHVATHGFMNARSPMFSRLELARPPADSVPFDNDGRLEVHELLDLQVRSPLVFLSGCETGVGAAWSTSFMRGEDYATLAAAFLFAGARNVVSTLWRIEDRGAAAFATAFYQELASRNPAEALARAQRSMIAAPEYTSPFYWAAYTLSGDAGTVLAQTKPPLSVQ